MHDFFSFQADRPRSPSTWAGHIPFAGWLVKTLRPRVLVELGTCRGDSYFAMCQAAREAETGTRCHAVDTWRGDAHSGFYGEEVYQEVLSHNQKRFQDFSTLHRMSFDEALPLFGEGSVDLLHIDGLHTYEAVKHDFESWRPKLAPDAIVLFHDVCVLWEGFGVRRFWDELSAGASNAFYFPHQYGLGVLACGNLPDDLAWFRPGHPRHLEMLWGFLEAGVREATRHVVSSLPATPCSRCGAAGAECARLREELARERLQAAMLRHTRSWRLTAPLRKGFDRLARSRPARALRTHFDRRVAEARGIMAAHRSRPSDTWRFRRQQTALRASRLAESGRGASGAVSLDVSVVLYRNGEPLRDFLESLAAQDYPSGLLHVRIVDNRSQDGTAERAAGLAEAFRGRFGSLTLIRSRKNAGYGRGHHQAVRRGAAPFLLICNHDIRFEPGALSRAVHTALRDSPDVASWEFRQYPHEHPKPYDPVTLDTAWSSHACVLMRRSAYEQAGGYDKHIFVYCEDVELSYRFRSFGWRLRYLPFAAIEHRFEIHQESRGRLQFRGEAFGAFYLGRRYGDGAQRAVLNALLLEALGNPAPFPGYYGALWKGWLKTRLLRPKPLPAPAESIFPFEDFSYLTPREGIWIPMPPRPETLPLVSVITRTIAGRESLLRQALQTVANQSYPRIEHWVVQDGGEESRAVAEEPAGRGPVTLHYVSQPARGRSAAANLGLSLARGDFVLFLDDDDLLCGDHIEHLALRLAADPGLSAVYSLAEEVRTRIQTEPEFRIEELGAEIPAPHRQPFEPQALRDHNFMPIQSVLFRRSLYLERGGMREDLDFLEDWELWARYARGTRFEYLPRQTSFYQVPADPEAAARRLRRHDQMYPAVVALIQNYFSPQ